MVYFILVAALLSVLIYARHEIRMRQMARDQLAARQTYEHISVPILVTSNFPDDPTVYQRTEAWRQNLRAAGNKYSEILPIVAYPFALGASNGSLSTWRTYALNCRQKEIELVEEWDKRIEAENNPLYNGHILNQQMN